MTNRNSLLKVVFLWILFFLSLLYAWPNVYKESPVVEISANEANHLVDLKSNVLRLLQENSISYQDLKTENDHLSIYFANADEQLRAKDLLQLKLGDSATVALNLVSSMPEWLQSLGAKPMKLGLDLKGGVHFLLDVDLQTVLKHEYEDLKKPLAQTLKQNQIFISGLRLQNQQGLQVRLRDPTQVQQAITLLNQKFSNFLTTYDEQHGWLQVKITETHLREMRQATLEQTMNILRNRVNELGVAEAVVQQQGEQRISVDLPGIQDAARAKSILGGTATLEFHLVDESHDPMVVQKTGGLPQDALLFNLQGRPIILKRQIVLNGDAISSASSAYDQQTAEPSVSIQLNASADKGFSIITRQNVGRRLAILYVETKSEEVNVNGKIENQ